MLLYIIISVFTPVEIEDSPENSPEIKNIHKGKLFGFMLVILGLFLFLDNLNMSGHFNLLGFRQQYIFPLLIVLCLIYLVLNSYVDLQNSESSKVLHISGEDKLITGVCGGLADYLNVSSFLTRGVFLIFILVTVGSGIIIYWILFLLLKKRRGDINAA
jgi:phage shock protein PspC (stress-responsive transcriptional regulator)